MLGVRVTLCDYCSVDNSGYVPYFGGNYWNSGDNVGLFYWNNDTSSNENSNIGARLINNSKTKMVLIYTVLRFPDR